MELLSATRFEDVEPVNYFVDDPAWDGASADEVLAVVPADCPVVFIADAPTMRAPHPLLAVNTVRREDCEDDEEYAYEMEYGREFRALPPGVYDVSVNLFIANMDFSYYASEAKDDPRGYYQGLPDSW